MADGGVESLRGSCFGQFCSRSTSLPQQQTAARSAASAACRFCTSSSLANTGIVMSLPSMTLSS
eukprot:4756121-Amphidinium_carterae.1